MPALILLYVAHECPTLLGIGDGDIYTLFSPFAILRLAIDGDHRVLVVVHIPLNAIDCHCRGRLDGRLDGRLLGGLLNGLLGGACAHGASAYSAVACADSDASAGC